MNIEITNSGSQQKNCKFNLGKQEDFARRDTNLKNLAGWYRSYTSNLLIYRHVNGVCMAFDQNGIYLPSSLYDDYEYLGNDVKITIDLKGK